MRKFIIMLALTLATPALAANLTTDMELGKTMADVETKLKDLGYEVRKSEMEDGKIEVYFVKDGKMGEVYVDPKTGKVTSLEMK